MGVTFTRDETLDEAFYLARRVLRAETYDEETAETAINVLAASSEPADIATVRLLRHRAWAIDGGEFPQGDDWRDALNAAQRANDYADDLISEIEAERAKLVRRLKDMGIAALIAAAIAALAVMAERHWTEANAAAIQNEGQA